MKQPMRALTLTIVGLIIFGSHASAKTYTQLPGDLSTAVTAGNCMMVDTTAEADESHVYTLNPDHTVQLQQTYLSRVGKNPTCGQLQEYVDSNMTLAELSSQLNTQMLTWLSNLKNSPLEGNTVSMNTGCCGGSWYLVLDGTPRKIPDWLTAMSWGLMMSDRYNLGDSTKDIQRAFRYNIVGKALEFNEGIYAVKIRTIWKEADRDFSSLPTAMADEFDHLINARSVYGNIFIVRNYVRRFPSDPYARYLDWNWMLSNPGQ